MLTFFDAIFLGPFMIRIFLLFVHAIGTGIEVVLVATTLGGLGAFCEVGNRQPGSLGARRVYFANSSRDLAECSSDGRAVVRARPVALVTARPTSTGGSESLRVDSQTMT